MERFTSLLLDIKYFPRFVPWKWEETLSHLALQRAQAPRQTYSLPGHTLLDTHLFRP